VRMGGGRNWLRIVSSGELWYYAEISKVTKRVFISVTHAT
jgi:hypothetical protein